LLAALGRDDTQTAGTLFNNWALALQFLGRPREAEKLFRRSIRISSSDDAEQSVSPMLLVNYARVLRDLGRIKEAAGYAERGYTKAQEAGDQVVINQSLLLRASTYRKLGDLQHAKEMLHELEPRLHRSLPAGHVAFSSLLSEQALIAQARGDLQSALDLSTQALTILEASVKAGREGAGNLPVVLARRSGIELNMHYLDKAVADAMQAVSMSRRTTAPRDFSSELGRDYLALGRALQAQGKTGQARAALQSAVEHLEHTLGSNNSESVAARRLANELGVENK
jgi:tetratricopeptide (TPR) repeat protein